MRLIEELEARAGAEESLFRAQLLREDAARLRRLAELARSSPDLSAFAQEGRRLGWTQGDARTGELEPALTPFLEAVYDQERGAGGPAREERVHAAWLELHRMRMERLIGCLSTPVPRPN